LGEVNSMEVQKIAPELPQESEPIAAPEVIQSPPLPESGLPEGWTMEQWQHYGQQWLNQQK